VRQTLALLFQELHQKWQKIPRIDTKRNIPKNCDT